MANVIEFKIKALDEFSAAFGKVENAVSSIKTAVATVAAAYPVAKFAGMVKDSLNMAEAAGQAAQKVGLTTKEFSAMATAAQIANVEQGSLMMAMKSLSNAMTDVESSGGKALAAIGVASRDAVGNLRPVNDVILDLADTFEKTRDDAAKSATAVALFGRSGTDMVPFLNQGRGAIEDMMKTAEELGLVFSDETAAAADAVNDNLELITSTSQGLVNRVTEEMLPVFESLSNQFLDVAKNQDNVRIISDGLSVALKGLVSAGIAVVTVFKGVGSALGAWWAAMYEATQLNFGAAKEILSEGFKDAASSVKQAADEIGKVWTGGVESAAAGAAKLAIAARKSGDSIKLATKEDEKAKTEKNKLAEAIADLERNLTTQIVTFGQSADAAKVMELRLKGATDEQLRQVEALREFHETQERKKTADEEAKALIDETATAYDKYIEKIAKINELQAEGALLEEQASELRNRAIEEYNLSSEAIELHKQTVTDWMAETAVMLEERLTQMGSWQYQIAEMMTNTAMTAAQSIGAAMAQVIVYGQSFSEQMKNVLKSVAAEIIKQLIAIGVQRLILAIISKSASAQQASSEMSKSLALVYTNSFASCAAIPWIGWAMAPGVAQNNLMTAIQGAGMAMGIGAGMGGAAHGGLDFVPDETTFLLQRGERVLSPRQNKDLTNFMEEGGNGGGSVNIQTVNIHVLENATNAEVFARMDRVQLRESLGQPVVDALNEMFRIGVRPDFASGQA